MEDLVPGTSHPWADGLRRCFAHLADRVPAGQPDPGGAVRRCSTVCPAHATGNDRIVSTWEEPLLEALFDGLPTARGGSTS